MHVGDRARAAVAQVAEVAGVLVPRARRAPRPRLTSQCSTEKRDGSQHRTSTQNLHQPLAAGIDATNLFGYTFG